MLYFQILQWLQARQNVEDASTRPILSATCVGTSQQLHSVEPSLPSSEPPTFTILTVKLVIRTSLGLQAAFNFAVPIVWGEPRNHTDDCYFCLTNITGFNAFSRKKIKYPNLRSAMRPVPHSDDLRVPTPPVNKDLLSLSDEEMPSREDSAESISLEDIESTYSGRSGNEPHWITQEDLNDLARDLYLSKQQSERCKDHQFQESEQIRSLVLLWVCKRASQSTVVFSISGIVELYPSITSRNTGVLEALLFLANTASRRIL